MIHVSYTDLRNNLAAYMDQANDDRAPIMVTRQGSEPVVLLAASEYAGMVETMHLMGNPRNAARLLESIAQADAGNFVEPDLVL